MARGQRKSIEEKIQQKQEIINALETRIEHERDDVAVEAAKEAIAVAAWKNT